MREPPSDHGNCPTRGDPRQWETDNSLWRLSRTECAAAVVVMGGSVAGERREQRGFRCFDHGGWDGEEAGAAGRVP